MFNVTEHSNPKFSRNSHLTIQHKQMIRPKTSSLVTSGNPENGKRRRQSLATRAARVHASERDMTIDAIWYILLFKLGIWNCWVLVLIRFINILTLTLKNPKEGMEGGKQTSERRTWGFSLIEIDFKISEGI